MKKTNMKYLLSVIVFFGLMVPAQSEDAKKAISIDNILAIKSLSDLQLSPNELWIAYKVSAIDTAKDKSFGEIWMVSTDGGEPIQMTAKESSASMPRWSPDGKYLSFLASKGEGAKPQVWTLNRLGGEAKKLTSIKQGVSGYEWSPDGSRLLLTIKDPKPADLTKDKKDDKKPLPHVIDRIHFKQDYSGYLDNRRTHLYTFTPGDSAAIQITSGPYDDSNGKWSPDGKSLAFVSTRSAEPDLSYDSNIWIVSADNTDKGASLRQLTTNPGPDSSPNWSPDGTLITYVTTTNLEDMPFAMSYLAVIPAEGGSPLILTEKLDRRVNTPGFSRDGKKILFEILDSGERQLASISPSGKEFSRLVKGEVALSAYKPGSKHLYTLHGYTSRPSDIYKWTGSEAQKLTIENDSLLSGIKLGKVEKLDFESADGTPIEGFVVKPPEFDSSNKYPLILWIHGGPIGQFSYSLQTRAQLLAANGYVVLLVNPRGSTGYGEDFTKAIFADWGNKDYDDVMAGVDHLIDQGYIDEEKLGVGGWSYGGILTNYVITKTGRFKAAISGASLGMVRANFGHDQYIKWYNAEFGLPWENRELWEKLSPFNNVEKITTPTLWIGGAVDWNVPIMNSEQMYLGMKTLGRETQLVVYPNEHHGIRRPSFQKDRFERFVAWYDNYLK
ncbi:MAG: S9 family peptidase [Bacteroides sp.]|nr:S9 family peptidase [Bacteroides sp.]